MTSNERKIINFLRDAKEKTYIRLIAKKTNFSSDYTQSLCHSLARAGYIKLEDSNVCHLLKKGLGHFESVAVMREVSEPVVVTANVTLLTDEPAGTPLAGDRDDKDKEENLEDGGINEKNYKQADDDVELDKALTELEPSSKKDTGEETKIADAEDAEAELKSEPEKETEEKEPVAEIGIEAKAEAAEIERKKQTVPQEMEMKKETKPADNPVPAAPLESHEKAATKEKPANKPSGSFGASFKKIVNWFAEKK